MTAATSRMTKRTRILIATATFLAIASVTVTAAFLTGILPGVSNAVSTYPPCDQLPSKSEVQDALSSNTLLSEKLEGADVQVRVGTPCSDYPDAALIQVSYTESASRAAIEATLTEMDGFGVPVYVVKR